MSEREILIPSNAEQFDGPVAFDSTLCLELEVLLALNIQEPIILHFLPSLQTL